MSETTERQAVTTPRAIGHVGVTVPDIEAAVAWYGDLFGFRLILPIADVDQVKGNLFEEPVADILGPQMKFMRMAFMVAANGCSIEIFEFPEDGCPELEDNFEYKRRGVSHFAVTDPDVAGMAERIVAAGGRQRSKVWTLFEGQPYTAVYCEDPWGTPIEVLSHGAEQMYSNLFFNLDAG